MWVIVLIFSGGAVQNPRVGSGTNNGVLVAMVFSHLGRRNSCQNVSRILLLDLFLLDPRMYFFAVDPNIWWGCNADLNPAGADTYDRELDSFSDND
jgi:hypothetical protein